MVNPTGVSRRIEQAMLHLQSNDYEGALVNLFPALDKTAKRRRPRAGVGKRIRAFLTDEEAMISAIASGAFVIKMDSINGLSFADVLYKFGRNSIAHEGELDDRLRFTQNGFLRIDTDVWELPAQYITGMLLSVIAAPENSREKLSREYTLSMFDKEFQLNELWGEQEAVEIFLDSVFKNRSFFKEHREEVKRKETN